MIFKQMYPVTSIPRSDRSAIIILHRASFSFERKKQINAKIINSTTAMNKQNYKDSAQRGFWKHKLFFLHPS